MSEDNFWLNKIKAFLHDPPDKLLSIASHEERRNYLLKAIGLEYDIEPISDRLSSQLQRAIIGDEAVYDFRRTESNYWPIFIHTITAEQKRYSHIENKVRPTKIKRILQELLKLEIYAISSIYSKDADAKRNYFNIWRFFPGHLNDVISSDREFGQGFAEDFINLPADSRFPDHTIWEHLDLASAIAGAISTGELELFLFKISPVQSFIASARKEKDLWAGSHLLSYLSLTALKKVVDTFGPDSIIFPYLRGQPLLDVLLFPEQFKEWDNSKLLNSAMVANIPNRFLAIVGATEENIKRLTESIKTEIKRILENIVEEALESIVFSAIEDEKLSKFSISKEAIIEDAKKRVSNYFTVTTDFLLVSKIESLASSKDPVESYTALSNFVEKLDLPESEKEKYITWFSLMANVSKYRASPLGLYGLMYELLNESVGYKSATSEKQGAPAGFKCTVCGKEVGIMGSAKNEREFKEFWSLLSERNYQIKKNERLCPICLVKRYYPQWFKKNILKKQFPNRVFSESIWFEDIATITLSKSVTYHNKQMKLIDAIRQHPKHQELIDTVITISRFTKLDKMLQVIQKVMKEELLPSQFYYPESFDYDRFERNWLTAKLETDDRNELIHLLNKAKEILSSIYEDISIKSPPKYYAILVIDGDRIGKALIGDTLKSFVKYIHPRIYETNKDLINSAMKKVSSAGHETGVKRILNPSVHIAISKALMYFSVEIVPNIIAKHNGVTIYSGGDDILALLPMDTVVKCAIEISTAFSKSFDGWNLLPGLSMSGGIIFSHYLNPLFDSLDKARNLEKKAKREGGRDSLFIGFLKRGGQYTIAGGKWNVFKDENFLKLLSYFLPEETTQRYYASSQLIYDIVQNAEFVYEDALKDFMLSEFYRHLHPMIMISSEEKRAEIKELVEGLFKLLPYMGMEEHSLSHKVFAKDVDRESPKEDTEKVRNMQKRLVNLFLLVKNLVESETRLGA